MKLRMLAIIIATLSQGQSSFAQISLRPMNLTIATSSLYQSSLSPYAYPYLKLLGRGIQNKKTGEVIALACMPIQASDPATYDCNRVRYLYLSANLKRAYLFGSVSDEGPNVVNALSEKYKFMLNYASFYTYEIHSRTPDETVIYARQFNQSVFNTWNAFTGAVEGSFSNTDGWNWSEKPIRVSSRVFESFLHFSDQLDPFAYYLISIYSVRD